MRLEGGSLQWQTEQDRQPQARWEDVGKVSLEMDRSGPLEPPQAPACPEGLWGSRGADRKHRDRKSQTGEGRSGEHWGGKGGENFIRQFTDTEQGRSPGPCQGWAG